MGLILDSSVIVAAERRKDTPAQLLRHVTFLAGNQEVAISTIGLTEIVHGIDRTSSVPLQLDRQAYIHDLLAYVDVLPYTKSTAWLAGRIDGEQRSAESPFLRWTFSSEPPPLRSGMQSRPAISVTSSGYPA
jgi:predicted nucleic acid-binding protein